MLSERASRGRRANPSEAEVVFWLKRALAAGEFQGRRASQIVVDQDPAYVQSRYSRQLKPTGIVRIGDWRPDLVCVIEQDRAERVAAFEVKGGTDHEKGVVQASRYRDGVHEAYLCVPMVTARPPAWLRTSAQQNGVGLVRAALDRIEVVLPPAPPKPDPRVLRTTRGYLLGQERVGALGLNKPLHYAAVLMALAFADEPWETLASAWGLQSGAVRLAARGAETLGLISDGRVTMRGRAYADIMRSLGFDLRESRRLTKLRLVDENPGLAAVLRSVMLGHPAVDLIVQALMALPGGAGSIEQVAQRSLVIDEGMALAVFGPPPLDGGPWQIRATTRFQLKAALYDVGLIETSLAKGAGGGRDAAKYDPSSDTWRLSAAFLPC